MSEPTMMFHTDTTTTTTSVNGGPAVTHVHTNSSGGDAQQHAALAQRLAFLQQNSATFGASGGGVQGTVVDLRQPSGEALAKDPNLPLRDCPVADSTLQGAMATGDSNVVYMDAMGNYRCAHCGHTAVNHCYRALAAAAKGSQQSQPQAAQPQAAETDKEAEFAAFMRTHAQNPTGAPFGGAAVDMSGTAATAASAPGPVEKCVVSRSELDAAVEAEDRSKVLPPAPGQSLHRCAVCGNSVPLHGLHERLFGKGGGGGGADEDADRPGVVRVRRKEKPGLSLWEHLSNGVSWGMCICMWLHLWVIIPLVETGTITFMDGYRPWYWIPTGVLYLLYLIQSAFAPTRQYLSSILERNVDEYVQHLRDAAPELWYDVQNYHYETRTEHYTDSKGNRRTRTKRVRVNTHYARGTYRYDEWRDTSDPMEIPANAAMSRLRLEKEHAFADEATRADYERAFATFVVLNSTDVYQDVHNGLEIDQFNKYVLAPRDPENVSKFFSLWVYIPVTIFTFSPFYRVLFFIRTHPVDWVVEKTIKTRAAEF